MYWKFPIYHTKLDKTWTIPAEYLSWEYTLQWHHNECSSISNHWHLECLLKHLFRCKSKKTSKLHIAGLCEGNPLVTSDSLHKGPVTWNMFPLEDIIMNLKWRRFIVAAQSIIWTENQLAALKMYFLKDICWIWSDLHYVGIIMWQLFHRLLFIMNPGLCSLKRHCLIGMGIPIINLRWSTDLHMFIIMPSF